MKPLVVIPARGGSKGIPRKNIRKLQGKPLIHYTIEAAREVFDDSVICVSTDDEEIKLIAESTGLKVPFIRPSNLATDTSGTYEVLMHAVQYYENIGLEVDTIILLQPTSPFRNSFHIKEAISKFDRYCEMLVSVKETKSNPYYVLMEENEDGWLVKSKEGNFSRRQDCPKVFELNGAIYIIDLKALKDKPISQFTNIKKYVMNDESSLDIDSEIDWKIAEIYLSNFSGK